MAAVTYEKGATALVVIDPYNDFNMPNYASAIVTANEVIGALSSL
jgi:hypothetical protein